MLQVKLGGSWSTPVMVIVLVMERSWRKGGSCSRAGSMRQGTKGEFSLWEALCQLSVLLWQPCPAWEKGLAVVCSQQLQWYHIAPFPDRGQGRPHSNGSQQHKSLKGKLPWSQLYQMFLFFVAKSSSLCSDLSFGFCPWAVLLGLVAKKRLSFSWSCLASTFWLWDYVRITTWTVRPWLLKHQMEVCPLCPEFVLV